MDEGTEIIDGGEPAVTEGVEPEIDKSWAAVSF
jgi:hypothetical protein